MFRRCRCPPGKGRSDDVAQEVREVHLAADVDTRVLGDRSQRPRSRPDDQPTPTPPLPPGLRPCPDRIAILFDIDGTLHHYRPGRSHLVATLTPIRP
jgi:hypothetical protein